jgi:hypothetical protein
MRPFRADLYIRKSGLIQKHVMNIRKPWDTGANLRPRGTRSTVGDLSITHPLNASGARPETTPLEFQ